ncbi:hypothetical protein [Pyrobaculum sp.]|uniref:hypothetical protein n=1 Tax=Pyrobaculum sp. TaxID=2004705 RepID=UPI003169B45A
MEILKAAVVLAVATAVAALMLYAFGYWPKALPYGEPLPYIALRNTSKGVEIGLFDYSGAAPATAYIYVNGKPVGAGKGWTGIYAKCGDRVEVFVQYGNSPNDRFQRKLAGQVSCSKPLKSSAVSGNFTLMSRNAIEAEAALTSLGIKIGARCKEIATQSGARYYQVMYPVFYITSVNSEFMEYQAGMSRYSAVGSGSAITIDPGGANNVLGVFRSFIHPPYGYTVSDYIGTRNVPLNFYVPVVDYKEVILGSTVVAWVSTEGYVELDGARYKIAECRYVVSTTTTKITYSADVYDVKTLEPDAVYEIFIQTPAGNVYRVTMAFYPGDKAATFIASRASTMPVGRPLGTIRDKDGKEYKVYVSPNLGEIIDVFKRMVNLAENLNLNPDQIQQEIAKAAEKGEGWYNTYGNPYNVTYRGKTYYDEVHVTINVNKRVKPGGVSTEYTWIAVPGVFRGLSNGGWDLFLTRYALDKIVVNSTTFPIVVTFG